MTRISWLCANGQRLVQLMHFSAVGYPCSECAFRETRLTHLRVVHKYTQAGDLKYQVRKALSKGIRFQEYTIWKYFLQIARGLFGVGISWSNKIEIINVAIRSNQLTNQLMFCTGHFSFCDIVFSMYMRYVRPFFFFWILEVMTNYLEQLIYFTFWAR